LREQMREMALALGVVGLMNAQFAVRGDDIYVLEVNPRASRTVPFVSKATGIALASVAARCMAGKSLEAQGMLREVIPDFFSVKEVVFPFIKFPGVDPILGPEMRSTGEVMGIHRTFGGACARAMRGAQQRMPIPGKAFLSVRDADKAALPPIARNLVKRGYTLLATGGTCDYLEAQGFTCERINKVGEGRPHVVDVIKNNEVQFIINTTEGRQAIADSFSIRREALQRRIPYTTTTSRGWATLQAIDHEQDRSVRSLQSLHSGVTT
jgi:carbamoyl-phosphate synthase large subunit